MPTAEKTTWVPGAIKPSWAPWNPYDSYNVRSLNKEYKGVSFKADFLNGRAYLGAQPADASEETVEFRVAQLRWFQNQGYAITKTDRRPVEIEEED